VRTGKRRFVAPQHVREKFLRQRNHVRVGSVLRLQEPTAQSRFHTVERVARCGLLRLKKYNVLKLIHERSEGPTRCVQFRKFRAWDLPCRTLYLDCGLASRLRTVASNGDADHAFPAGNGRFDLPAVLTHDVLTGEPRTRSVAEAADSVA
jgi:hypothetical protein